MNSNDDTADAAPADDEAPAADATPTADAIPTADEVVSLDDVEAARERLSDVVHRTPLDRSTTFAEMADAASVGLKLENVQRTGSFKIRGAYHKISRLPAERRERGVVASSAGNHAQGVALAGRLCDVETTVVVPEVTPAAKIDATREYGAEVVVEGEVYEESYQHALDLADERGLTFVHPFDDERIIAGQGTVGLELREQYPELDTAVVAIGGGGLVSGVATALKAHDPEIRVVGVQPEGAAHAKPSLERDEIHELSTVDTVAEGIADARLLEKTFAVVRERVDEVVSVSDRETSAAVALLAERAKTVAEAAGAAPLAAVLSDDLDVEGEHVGVVVSGGNVNLTDHAELARAGLSRLGRYAEVRLAVADWPTDLAAITEVLDSHGVEVDALERARRTAGDDPNRVPVTASVAGSGPDHLAEALAAVEDLDGVSVIANDLREDALRENE